MSETSPPPRRFVPELVETTSKSSRRFAAEPIETTTRSSKAKPKENVTDDMAVQDSTPKRRFLPEPIETSTKTNRGQAVKPAPELTPEPSPRTPSKESSDSAPSTPRERRKFTPQLIETSKRSKKAGDSRPATLPTDKTDITPGTNHIYLPRRKAKPQRPPPVPVPLAPENTPINSSSSIDHILPQPPRRQGSMRPHPNTRRSTRQNSFLPELDPIISEENSDDFEDGEDLYERTPSLSGSFGSSEDSIMRMQLARTRESCDDRFSGYLLELAAKAAEKQLREQALAAFPNNDFGHEIVEHFYDREEGSDEGDDGEVEIGVGLLPHEMLDRRQSTEVGWAAKEMQQHQETLARQREEDTNQKIADEATKPSWKDPFWTNGMSVKSQPIIDRLKEAELDKMRSAASPPMLGADLKFRMCPSPKATRFETDQDFEVLPNRRTDGGGLWGGYCVAEDDDQYLSPVDRGPAMISTPNVERDDPFASAFSAELSEKPSRPTSTGPKAGLHMLSGIEERMKTQAIKAKFEESMQLEFNDRFVTQVYNYLSLGYPSLARHYDEELSKISNIPEQELSKDDSQKDVQGHIGLIEGEQTAGTGARCPRWNALRVYILEWARQHPGMNDTEENPQAWGVRARRGSWAI